MDEDILKRLQGYNSPDRTTKRYRLIATDVQDAAVEIARLRAEVAELKRQIEVLTDYDTTTLIFMKDAEVAVLKRQLAAEKTARRDAADLGHERIVDLERQLTEAREILANLGVTKVSVV